MVRESAAVDVSAVLPSPTMLADSLWGSRRLWERTPEVREFAPGEVVDLVPMRHVLVDPLYRGVEAL